ncbi:MAG: hypothetical protein HBSAPP03_13780 [Phycisphaerae bacterium]|nr:MAG: hypothetical protein HBSAPP03_13780 [Phycisphaerae bacterium]
MSRAFSLLELVVTVAMIGIIVTIAAPRMSRLSESARIAATQETVRRAQYVLDEQQAITGEYPGTLRPEWFPHGRIVNGLLPDQATLLQVVAGPPEQTDPSSPIAGTKAAAAFWYNSANGHFRARIPSQGSQAANAALYRKVNLLPPNVAVGTGIEITDAGGESAMSLEAE